MNMDINKITEAVIESALKVFVADRRNSLLDTMRAKANPGPKDWPRVDQAMAAIFECLNEAHLEQVKLMMVTIARLVERHPEEKLPQQDEEAFNEMTRMNINSAALSSILRAHLNIYASGERMNAAHLHIGRVKREAAEADEVLTFGIIDKDGLHIRGEGSNG
jgi:hypothetical protein